MKIVLSYALLIATWIFLIAIIVYLWVAKALEPPYWSFIILLAVAALPLASRLRIGNWFDFTKKVDGLTQEVNSNKKEIQQLSTQITNISSQLQNVMLTKQAQHQIVANLPNPETAKAFAQSFAISPDSLYPPPAAKLNTKEDRNVLYFLWAADKVIFSAQLILMAIYVFAVSFLEGNESVIEDKRAFQPLKLLIRQLRQIYDKYGQEEPFPLVKEPTYQHLNTLENLIDLRESIAQGKLPPPTTKEGQDIISKATMAVYQLSGILSAISIAAALYCPPSRKYCKKLSFPASTS